MTMDALGRPLRDLRISVTDRCNFRCTYCMPKKIFNREYEFLQRDLLLTFEEITRVASVFAGNGVEKVRITGGEPLLRRNIEDLLGMLAQVKGITDVTLTTNGSLLERKAEGLAAAGLKRVTVSLDSIDDEVFVAMNDVGFPATQVLDGITAASEAGISVKINMVVKRSFNDHTVVEMAEHFRGTGHTVRFIEYMDVGTTNGWRLDDVVSGAEIVKMISKKFPLTASDPNYVGEVARRWEYTDGQGEIGVITSVTEPFCSTCTRARISAEGVMYTCLFASFGQDLRGPLREGATDEELSTTISSVWSNRVDQYSEIRSTQTVALPKVEMSYIGG